MSAERTLPELLVEAELFRRDAERDLAIEIHHEIISPARVDAALATWRQNPQLDERKRMWIVLANASGLSCDAVLARRQREAARTGPWGEP